VPNELNLDDLAPLGFYKCGIDSGGRLKAPSVFHDYLRALGAKFFVTSYDDLDIHMYTRSAFIKQCRLLEDLATKPEFRDDAQDTLFRMRDLGVDLAYDDNFRFTLPQEFRQRLNINTLPGVFYIGVDRDHILVKTEGRHLARRDSAAKSDPVVAAERLQLQGLR